MEQYAIAVLAVGTRGDVQPLLALAIALRRGLSHPCRVTLVTHSAHENWVQRPAEAAGVHVILLSAPPARTWEAAPPAELGPKRKRLAAGADGASSSSGSGSTEDQRREEILAACEAALGLSIPAWPPTRGDTPAATAQQAEPAHTGAPASCAGPSSPTPLLIFNLFALEGFHIAEALGIPCVAASPCLVPYAAPPGLERRFREAHPELYRSLRAADERVQGAAVSVGWSDVRHWLWSAFTERWGAWRYHRLGLPAVPYSGCPPGTALPSPPLLLYGVSDSVVPRPGFWPRSARMCGYWSSHDCFAEWEQRELPPALHWLDGANGERQGDGGSGSAGGAGQEAAAAVAGRTGREAATAGDGPAAGQASPICVDFGSMGLMGLLPQPRLLAAVLQAAAQRLGRRIVVLTAGWQPLLAACRELEQRDGPNSPNGSAPAGRPGADQPEQHRQQQNQQQQAQQPGQQQQVQHQAFKQLPWVVALHRPVPHDLLLPRCAAVLHHGGAGTVAAALRAGTPQLVCPLHFDQQQWAERVCWLGCGTQLRPSDLLQGQEAGGEEQRDGAPSEQRQPPPDLKQQQQQGQQQQQQQQGQQQAVQEAGQVLADALHSLLCDGGIREQCSSMRERLAGEDGLAAAVQSVQGLLDGWEVWQAGQAQQAQSAQAGWQQHNTGPEQQQQQQGASELPPSCDGAASAKGTPAPAGAAAPLPMSAPAPQHVQLPGGLGVQCISPGEALFIHREIFQQDCYLPAGICLAPGSVVVDAGANIGLFALRVLLDTSLSPCVDRIFAFEPLGPIADVLDANLGEHGVADKVTVLRCGLHSCPARLPFTFYPAMPGNSTAAPREKWEHQRPQMAALMGSAAADACFQGAARVECPVTSLAAFVRQHHLQRIDLLKVDVEGSELEVLLGLEEETWRIVRQVVMEVHDVGERLAAATRVLERAGFAVHAERQPSGPAGNWLLYAWQLHVEGLDCNA